MDDALQKVKLGVMRQRGGGATVQWIQCKLSLCTTHISANANLRSDVLELNSEQTDSIVDSIVTARKISEWRSIAVKHGGSM